MIKIKKLLSVAVLASISATLLAGCGNNNGDIVLAKVGDKTIYLSDVDKELKGNIDALIEEYGEDYEKEIDENTKEELKNARISILQELVEEAILINKAKELNLIPSDEELSESIDAKRAELINYYGNDETLQEAIDFFGYTEETFNEFLKNRVIEEIVIQSIIADTSVTDEEISTYYNEHTDEYTTGAGAHAKHILFEDEESANKASQSIIKGETTFDDLFTEYKENKSSMQYPLAEDLDFVQFEEPNFDAEFLAGFKTLTEGEISTPIKSSFGYHIIKAYDFSNETSVTPFEEVKDEIHSQLLYEKQYEIYQNKLIEWQEELKVKTYEDKIK